MPFKEKAAIMRLLHPHIPMQISHSPPTFSISHPIWKIKRKEKKTRFCDNIQSAVTWDFSILEYVDRLQWQIDVTAHLSCCTCHNLCFNYACLYSWRQWQLLQTARSHLATLIVPLLLHCMTLPTGATVLWHLVEDDFSSDDWKVRFAAGKYVCTVFIAFWWEGFH